MRRVEGMRAGVRSQGAGVQEFRSSGVRSQESGVRSQEPGARSQEPGVQESGARSSGARSQEQESEAGVRGVRMRKPAKTFRELIVWQRAHQFVLAIYKTTENFPRHEMYGLVSQTRRASVSIAANIAEGFRKRTAADKARFLNIAQGSLEEVRYYLILAEDLKYANSSDLHALLTEVSKLLNAYRNSILNSDS